MPSFASVNSIQLLSICEAMIAYGLNSGLNSFLTEDILEKASLLY